MNMGRLWLPADERRGACLLYSRSCDCSLRFSFSAEFVLVKSTRCLGSLMKDCLTCRREENGGSYASSERVGLSSAEAYVEWCVGCWCERAMNMGRLWLPADERRGACLLYSCSCDCSVCLSFSAEFVLVKSTRCLGSLMKDCLTCRREEKDGSSLSLGIE